MTDKFKKFLIEHDCLDDYNNYSHPNEISIFDFDWDKTEQGYEYWSKLCKLWTKIFDIKQSEKSKIYVYQYCLLSNNNRYSSGFLEYSKIRSAKDAIDFKEELCELIKLNPEETTIINVNVIGERDA